METARIMVWGYNAPMNPLGDGTTMNVSRFASNLLNELSVNDLDVDKVSNLFASLQGPMTVFLKDKSGCLCVP